MFKNQLGNLMQQAQRMQENMQRVQEELANIEVTGKSGGGTVTILMTAKMEVRRVTIDRETMSTDPEMTEDLLVAAFNDAVNKANEASQAKMAEATAGMPLPPGMKLPF